MSTVIQVKDLSPNQTYYFAVTAYNTGKVESDRSNEVSYTVPAPIAPVLARASSLTVNEDSSLPITLAGDCSDASANKALWTFAITSGPRSGTLSGTPPNLVYSPASNYHGPDSFEFTVDSGSQTSSPARIDIQVQPVNDAPRIANALVPLKEDSQGAFQLTITDPDSSTFTHNIVQSPTQGQLTGSPSGMIYRPNPNFFGTDQVQLTVSDGLATSEPATITFSVAPDNDAPIAVSQSLQVTAGSSIPVIFGASDVDNDPLAFVITKAPAGGTLSGTGSTRTYTARSDFSGTDTIDFAANDGKATSPTATITIAVRAFTNTAPTAIAQSKTVAEDGLLPLTLTATDRENQSLNYVITAGPKNGVLTGIPPAVTYQPNANFNGTDSFDFSAHDGLVGSAPARVTINVTAVNDAPIADAVQATINEDNSVLLQLSGRDIEGSALTYAISAQPTRGRLMGTPPSVRYVPNNNTNGVDTFRYVVRDGSLTSAAATVTVVINPVNDAPVATARSFSLSEDRPFSFALSGTDVDGNSLSYVVTQLPTQGTITGTPPALVYTPNTNYFGSDFIEFTATDGTLTSAPSRVSFTVVSVNDAPVARNANIALTEDNAVSFKLEASDVEGSPLTYIIRSRPLYGVLTGSQENMTYTPRPDFNGTDSMTFNVSDGVAGSTYAKITFTVSPVNDAPVAIATPVSTTYGTAVVVTLAGSDAEKSALTYRITRAPSRGTLTGTAPRLTYKPASGFFGTDSLEFTVSDGTLVSAPVTLAITVNAPAGIQSPQPDVAIVGAYGTTSTLLNGDTSVMANDGDTSLVQVTLVQSPRQGTVSLAPDGRFTYRHTGGSSSEDSFTYVTTVDGASSEPVSVQVHVFDLAGLNREGEEVVLSFPTVPGVLYRIEGNTESGSSSANWQSLGEVTSETSTIVEVPTAAPADAGNHYFRIAAVTPAGTIHTDAFGFQRRNLQAGVQTLAAPFQGTLASRVVVASAGGNTLALGTPSLANGQWNPRSGLATHAVVVSGGSQWWPILSSEGGQLTLDARGADLASTLQGGQSIDIVRLSSALDLFGSPDTTDHTLQPGDFVDFVNGNGTVSTLECLEGTEGGVSYRLLQNGSDLGSIPASDITFLDGQPIQIQKADASGTIWFLGRVLGSPLAPYRASNTGTSGTLVE